MNETNHVGFVIAAYAIAAVVLIGMVLAVFADYRAQQKALRRLEGGRERTGAS
ncbi:MAG TPA: heme exporter protein CcmD [Roseiarcus sp.]|jgi:heme exporter protein CcmD|nr:heme exporter protein CcmD [Roseiarcus sp.]